MTIESDLTAEMKTLMRAKDSVKLTFNKALRALILEKKKSPGFEGEITDEIAIEIITGYQKKLTKALDQFGDKGDDYRSELEAEIDYCQSYLPAKLSAAEIGAAIAEVRASGVDNDNMVMREIMSRYKGRVDGKQVKELLNA